MYTESRNNFSLRNVILQFLFLALLVFILIWLFPTKKDMKKGEKTTGKDNQTTIINNTDLSVLYDRIFNDNLMSMKEAAQSYYTTERLPQVVGDSTKITLREMLDKKIILPFKDKNGKQCNLDSSYVTITKKENEFVMKVNLKCGEEENYLLTYMGCYDYCSQTICEKKGYVGKVYNVTTSTTPKPVKYYCKVVNGKYYDKNGNVVSKSAYENSCIKKVVKYYCKVVNGKYYDNNGRIVSKAEYEDACSPKKYYCKIVNGKYYDNNGNKVSKSAYEKACIKIDYPKYYCKIVNGKYYDNYGNEVSKTVYEEACIKIEEPKYYCKIVNGKYYDDKGNIVSESAYEKACVKIEEPKYYCKKVNGIYYDNNGNKVSKAAYEKACVKIEEPKYYCKIVNGIYYDNNGNKVSKTAYEKACIKIEEPKYYCKIVNGKYYDKSGNVVSKTAYEDSCFEKVDYICEYKKVTEGTVKWSEWSEWSETYKAPSDTVEVQKKTTSYKKLKGYNVKGENDLTKPIIELKDVVVGSTTVKSCSKYNVTTTITGYTKQYIGRFKYTVAPKETTEYTYVRVGGYNWYCDPNCTAGTVLVYDKYQKVPQTSTSYSCAKYETEKTVYVTQKSVITGYQKKTTKTPVYDYYDKVTYRYRTKTTTPGTTVYQWSKQNDTTLLNSGYTFTGTCKVK